jgi:hypothetical protein
MRLLVVMVAASCGGKDPVGESKPREVTPMPNPPPVLRDPGWVDRCLGDPRLVTFDPDQLDAARAASQVALHGTGSSPYVAPADHKPERQAEIDLTFALAMLAGKRDATAAIDAALVRTAAIDDATKRETVLRWGAIELRDRKHARADTWRAKLSDESVRSELAAREVGWLAEAGDFAGARKALAALPATWDTYVDSEYWHGPPRWYGSAAVAACAALAHPAVASSAAARGLVEDAERQTSGISEDLEWRENTAYRALAFAWARLGDLDRAVVVASRMPGGSERSRVLAELIDRFGDTPSVKLSRLETLAHTALAATRSAPMILGKADVVEMRDFIEGALHGEVTAAIVRRHVARQDFAAAREALAKIPKNYSLRYETSLQVSCAANDHSLRGMPDGDLFAANLVGAAARVGCMQVLPALLQRGRFPERVAANVLRELIASATLDHARSMFGAVADRLSSGDAADIQGALAEALAKHRRFADAIAFWNAAPRHAEEYPQKLALAAGHRLVVMLVEAGELASARALHATLR